MYPPRGPMMPPYGAPPPMMPPRPPPPPMAPAVPPPPPVDYQALAAQKAQRQSVHEERPLEKSRAPPPGAPGQPPEDGRLERGRILWFDRDKNFGFIAAEVGGENVFIHGFDVKGFEPDSGDPRTSRPPAKNDLTVFIRGRDVGGRLK